MTWQYGCIYTASGPFESAYKLSSKLKYLYFDETYRQKFQYSQCQINIVRFAIKCTLIVHIFCIVGVDIFKNKFGQSLQSLTWPESNTRSKKDQREYIHTACAGRTVEDNVSRSSVSQRSGAHTARLPSDEQSTSGSGQNIFMPCKNMFLAFYKKCLSNLAKKIIAFKQNVHYI